MMCTLVWVQIGGSDVTWGYLIEFFLILWGIVFVLCAVSYDLGVIHEHTHGYRIIVGVLSPI